MKRACLLATTLILLLALGAVVFAEIPAKTGMPRVAQARLDQYLAYAHPSADVAVQTTVHAEKPWSFDKGMSGGAFGDSVYFQTDSGPTWTEVGNLLPLPYPPRDLWCVLLNEEPTAEEPLHSVVFVALHMDMYSGDWLVHEAPQEPTAPNLRASLAAIGCELGLE
jgi:hypothetical protein